MKTLFKLAACFASATAFNANALESLSSDGSTTADLNAMLGVNYIHSQGVTGQGAKIANVEGGLSFFNHDIFSASDKGGIYVPSTADTSVTGHATACAGIMAGDGGVASGAKIYSGTIATQANSDGTFAISGKSFYDTYENYFTTQKADVINSSWGNNDAGNPNVIDISLNALIYNYKTTTLVVAAGNSGAPKDGATTTVATPARLSNSISVGALGNPNSFNAIASFSSRGPVDFYNYDTGQTLSGVRVGVDVVAPGQNIGVATYLTGNPSITGAYSYDSGTSFAAPIVSGVVSLLYSDSYAKNRGEESRDARLMKAVIINSADKVSGWDNGQRVRNNVQVSGFNGAANASFDNVIVTDQSLDYTYGGGALNAKAAYEQYAESSTWIMGDVALGGEYVQAIGTAEAGDVLTTTLTWFEQIAVGIDDSGDDYSFGYGDAAFSNLDLEVWYYDAAADAYSAVALSDSLYNSVEHLSFALEAAGQYFLRVVFDEMIYGDLLGDAETFALVWNLAAIPEAAEFAAMFGLLALIFALRRKAG